MCPSYRPVVLHRLRSWGSRIPGSLGCGYQGSVSELGRREIRDPGPGGDPKVLPKASTPGQSAPPSGPHGFLQDEEQRLSPLSSMGPLGPPR